MSAARTWEVMRLELKRGITRPSFWVMVAVLLLIAWGLSGGNVTIQSGDTSVGGKKAFVTSEFAQAKLIAIFDYLVIAFVMAGIAGLAVHRDEEQKLGEILHSTPLKPQEYVIGKYAAGLFVGLTLLLVSVLCAMFFNHVVPNDGAIEVRGPFSLANYLRPLLVFGIPALVFVTGIEFAVGTRTRSPVLVYLLPVALVIAAFPLWEWAPSWLSPGLNRLLMAIDPAGARWLSETWLKVDRGVDFYNTSHIPLDLLVVMSRVGFAALGLLAVGFTASQYGATLRGTRGRGRRSAAVVGAITPARPTTRALPLGAITGSFLKELAMRVRRPAGIAATFEVARVEAKALLKTPSLYLFIPLIVIQVIGTATFGTTRGLGTEVLSTSGLVAVRAMNTLCLLGSLLLLFHAVESLNRERSCRLDSIHGTLPVSPIALVFGKALALTVVPLMIYVGSFLGALLSIAIDGQVPFEIGPFVLTWCAILLPSFFAFGAFGMAAYALLRERLTTWTVGLVAISTSLYQQLATDHVSWVWNWMLWDSLRWSDLSTFEFDRKALILNRVLWIGAGVFFVALAARFARRRESDSSRTLLRLRPLSLAKSVGTLLPWLVWPVTAGIVLHLAIEDGPAGADAKKHWKDYWGKNVATFHAQPTAMITGVELTVKLWPETRAFAIDGAYRVEAVENLPLGRIAVTPGFGWQDVQWTEDGVPTVPEDRAGLLLFAAPGGLTPGRTVSLGFSYHGEYPAVASKNGGGDDTFVLPSGVVMTSFEPKFFPMVGFLEAAGVDKDNKNDPRDYPDDWYRQTVPHWMHLKQPFPVTTHIEGPANFVLNGVGVKTEDVVKDGRRAVTWKSDHPVDFVNVVAGPLIERRGEGTAVWYHPAHTYNIAAMVKTLDAARRQYSEWFAPYPWQELKVTEFPGIADYAQGFATNITFSESIGFLTKPSSEIDLPFLVTAHESAHQWWGNLFSPGAGPGADFLSEGMAHFSTALLFEHEKGDLARMKFLEFIENNYANARRADGEPSIDVVRDAREGDKNVKYDKGGFVMWMLLHHMGRENCLAGLRKFFATYANGPDFALPPDLVNTLREFAPDKDAYDAFTRQWFAEVVVPEYKVSDAKKDGGVVRATVKNVGTGKMQIEVAATKGTRMKKAADDAKEPTYQADPDYKDARVTITLDAGESKDVAIPCDFDAEKVVVDPDVNVLQLNRKLAFAEIAK